MADEQTGKYRERVEDADTGLTREADLQRRPSFQGLTLEGLEELPEASTAELVPLADRLIPQADTEDALPDFGVGLLLERQKSDKCRALLERAQALSARGEWRPALVTVDQAVAADPASAEAWALKGRCLAELGHNEAGLRVLRYARDRVSDPDLRILVLRLEAICVRNITRKLEERLVRLVEEHNLDQALELVGEGLRQQPSNIVLLHHLANLHWMRGERESAQKAVEEARRHVGRENVDLIAELERRFAFGAHKASVEAARLLLRQQDAAGALAQLDTCRAQLDGNEHYDGLREYAEQKRGGLSRLLGGGGHVAPQGALRQQTLRWLLSEELKQAEEASRRGDYRRACEALEATAKIDPDCGAVHYQQARAIVSECRKEVERSRRAGAAGALAELGQAEERLQRALIDQSLDEQVKALRQAIAAVRQRLG